MFYSYRQNRTVYKY